MDTKEFLYSTQNSLMLCVYSECWLHPQPSEAQICSEILVLFSESVKWTGHLMLTESSETCSCHSAQWLWDHHLLHESVIHLLVQMDQFSTFCFGVSSWRVGRMVQREVLWVFITCFCPNTSLFQQTECLAGRMFDYMVNIFSSSREENSSWLCSLTSCFMVSVFVATLENSLPNPGSQRFFFPIFHWKM